LQSKIVVLSQIDEHRAEIMAREFRANANVEVGRFKGLGEMMPAQLKETTMDPKKRTLLKVMLVPEDRAGALEQAQAGTWRNRGTGIVLVPATPMERYHVQERSVCRPRCVSEGNVDLRHR
jgi:hypothetical protein